MLMRLGIAMAVLLCSGSVAHADEEIGLSNDGVTWSSSLPEPLFDPDFRWVPGDSETAAFHVRNQGPTSALMTIEARSADTDELLENDDIRLRARAEGGDWVSLDNGEPSESLTARSIRRGESTRVDVNATFDPASTNQSQRKELRLRFSVDLADARAGDGGDADGSGDSPGGSGAESGESSPLLPGTGSATTRLLLVIGAIMTVAGLVMAARRDRRREEVPHG